MGGCFSKKFPLISVLTLTSGFGFRKFQMDKFPGGKEVIFFFLKDVFWLLALLTTLKANPRTSDEDVLPLGGTVFSPFLVGAFSDTASHWNVHTYGDQLWMLACGYQCRCTLQCTVVCRPHLFTALYFNWSRISVPVLPASMAGRLNSVMAGPIPFLGSIGG